MLLSGGASEFDMYSVHRVPSIVLLDCQALSVLLPLWHLLAAVSNCAVAGSACCIDS